MNSEISKKTEMAAEAAVRLEGQAAGVDRDGRRLLLLSAESLRMLRRWLYQEAGPAQAAIFLQWFGYAAGTAEGLHQQKARAPEPLRRLEQSLSQLGRAGLAKFVALAVPRQLSPDAGRCRFEIEAHDAVEAEPPLDAPGSGEEPCCWIISGYLSGYFSALFGGRLFALEQSCQAAGGDHCHFVVDIEANFAPELLRERCLYRSAPLPGPPENLAELPTAENSLSGKRPLGLFGGRLRQQPLTLQGMLGESESLMQAMAMARLAAPVDSTVLLLGESGTGKELLARAIHQNSKRANRPFIAVNCSALPETLQEAELFGYKKGAFTGAMNDHVGLFESADEGTLLLDEIGDLTPSAQTKILRALQESEIKRVGEVKQRKVNVRIIAATNKDLEKMVQEKTFRADLYYRLNVVSIKLPPLRERENDALLIADYFVHKYAAKFAKKSIRGLSREARRAIMLYPWPGNIRELRNAIERAVILARGPEIAVEELPDSVVEVYAHGGVMPGLPGRRPAPELLTYAVELKAIKDESERLRMALNLVKGNRDKAAALLGISRTTLWRRMQKLKRDEE